MASQRQDQLVSVVMGYSQGLTYSRAALASAMSAVLGQDHGNVELIITDDRGVGAAPDFLPEALRNDARVVHLLGNWANRAARCNAALLRASGDLLLFIDNLAACVTLRTSAVRALVMAAGRHPRAGLVYADYSRLGTDGTANEVHLLDYHPGRLRDTVDFGPAILYPANVLEQMGGFDESHTAADQYDLRLRISESCDIVHLGNRTGGSLYEVAAPPADHDVFDYLRGDRRSQSEFERALTEHLKRTGACLPPDLPKSPIEYSAADLRRFEGCLASVVIPVNNRPQFIGRAIESVAVQTAGRIETIVVVNGGPDDPTIEAVRQYQPGGERFKPDGPPVRLIVLDVNNIGLCLNVGIDAAAGKYYVQLDSDDRLKPDAIEKLVAVFDSDHGIGMVIGSYEVWELDQATGQTVPCQGIPVVKHEEWTDGNGPNNLLRVNGAGAPRSAHVKVIKELGGSGLNDSPHSRNYGEDYDLVLRMAERYRIGRVTEPIYEAVRHPGGTDHTIDQATINRNDNAKDHMRREALRRRRAINKRLNQGGTARR